MSRNIKTNKKHYDVLLVGAGLFNAVLAHRLNKMGKSVLVIDRRNHIAGNCYTRREDGIDVHQYGAHIFHTSVEEVWSFVNQFATFNHYINSPIAITDCNQDEAHGIRSLHAVNMPFNMNTFSRIFASWSEDAYLPADIKAIIAEEAKPYKKKSYANLEEKALSMVGPTIYNLLIKGYTEKQWGCSCLELSPDIITRLPLRFTYDNNYFNDKYQGIPVDGYTSMIEKMFDGSEIKLNVDFNKHRKQFLSIADKIYYSGCIDEFYDYKFGRLDYRSLRFKEKKLKTDSMQGTAVFNYTTHDFPYTRSIEHKFFNIRPDQKGTIISYEYPAKMKPGMEPYYPVNNEKNDSLHEKYWHDAEENYPQITFVGRLGYYRYFDMDDTIWVALQLNLEE